MKKIMLLMLTALASQSMLAMEPAEQANNATLSQADELGKKLIGSLKVGLADVALGLMRDGANVNYIELDETSHYSASALMRVAFGDMLSRGEQLVLAEALLVHGADINLADHRGRNALWYVKHANFNSSNEIASFLIDAGVNTSCLDLRNGRLHKILERCGNYGNTFLAAKILVKATQLNDLECNSVKNWLLTEQRLRNEGNRIFKDLKKPIACRIIQSLAEDMKDRVIAVGANECRKLADENINLEIITLIDQYLDLDFLIKRVREQTRLS